MDYSVGIDLGSTSLGWSAVEWEDGKPRAVKALGVRIFSDGREQQTKTPLAVTRREKRGQRRQRARFKSRQEQLMAVLKKHGFWPDNRAEALALAGLDPYELRARALDEPLSRFELGRALFHLNQRRGFKSNRRTDRADPETGNMKLRIAELQNKLGSSGARTLGEYLYRLNRSGGQLKNYPEPVRVRPYKNGARQDYNLYPSRTMYQSEFERIWAAQEAYHPKLTPEFKAEAAQAIFYQRPLRPAAVGFCLFENRELRAPKALPSQQLFRILTETANLEFRDLDYGEAMSPEQRAQVVSLLRQNREVKFAKIRKNLQVSHVFNLEENRDRLKGDETGAALGHKKAFGPLWAKLPLARQDEVVLKLLQEDDDEALTVWLQAEFPSLTPENIAHILEVQLPEGYGRISAKALGKIIPHLEAGHDYAKSCELAGYHHSLFSLEIQDFLPYYGQVLAKEVIGGTYADKDRDHPELYYGKINNPTVHIALNQLRRVVNEMIRVWGKPREIVVEVARELKMSREDRKKYDQQRQKNQADNQRIKGELEKLGVANNYRNRMKYKLWEDLAPEPLKRVCPFCGAPIALKALFSPDFEVEHLVPFSQSYNDGRVNKVVACQSCNREKGNDTPHKAFGHDPERWAAIVGRVDNFQDKRKGRFFSPDIMEKLKGREESVIARMLTDTQYMSKIALKYLAAIIPASRVRVIPGRLTHMMRQAWGLNKLLSADGLDSKNRADHRHHALDALTVALTSRYTLQSMAKAAEKADHEGYRQKLLKDMEEPLAGFLEQTRQALDRVIVSHKPDHGGARQAAARGRTVAGLHEQTAYGPPPENEPLNAKGLARFFLRKPLTELKAQDIEKVVDEGIRRDLENLQARVGGSGPAWAQALAEYGQEHHIRRVKTVEERKPTTMIAVKDKKGRPFKYYASGGNYCVEIYRPNRGRYKNKWQVEVISNFQAHQPGFQPQWRRDQPQAKLMMRLFKNDMVAWEENGARVIKRVRKMTGGLIYFEDHQVANTEKISSPLSAKQLQERQARQVRVDVLGRVFDPGPLEAD